MAQGSGRKRLKQEDIDNLLNNSTPFERKVLKVTSTIPAGETRTYQWIARRIRNPRAVRAVGRVLSKNPLPVMIPCHRVIRKDGTIGGYSLGEKEKEVLLRKEGVKLDGRIRKKGR